MEFESSADNVACDELNELRLLPAEPAFDRLTIVLLVCRLGDDSMTTTCVGEMAVEFNGLVAADVDVVADDVVAVVNDGDVSRF